MADVLFYGPFPGPVTGQTVMTRFVFDVIRERDVDALEVNAARGNTNSTLVNTVVRLGRLARAVGRVLMSRSASSCYVSLDANIGMAATVLVAAAARLRGLRLFVHHHTYSHIGADSRLFRLLCTVAPMDTTHITICDTMAGRLRDRYPQADGSLTLSNVCSLSRQPAQRSGLNDRPLVLGSLSNLTFAKGVREAVEASCALNDAGQPARLILAGPVAQEAREYVEDAVTRHDHIEWIGPVYGADKRAFYAGIDVFLFPTKYANETQGIVNLEALASGVPVVAFNRCCVGDDLAGLHGWAVPTDADFASHVVDVFNGINADSLAELQRVALERFDLLAARGQAELDALVECMRAP